MESLLKIDQFQVVIMASAEEGLEQLEVDDPFDFVISGYTLTNPVCVRPRGGVCPCF